jgi:hypothetical protein
MRQTKPTRSPCSIVALSTSRACLVTHKLAGCTINPAASGHTQRSATQIIKQARAGCGHACASSHDLHERTHAHMHTYRQGRGKRTRPTPSGGPLQSPHTLTMRHTTTERVSIDGTTTSVGTWLPQQQALCSFPGCQLPHMYAHTERRQNAERTTHESVLDCVRCIVRSTSTLTTPVPPWYQFDPTQHQQSVGENHTLENAPHCQFTEHCTIRLMLQCLA